MGIIAGSADHGIGIATATAEINKAAVASRRTTITLDAATAAIGSTTTRHEDRSDQ
jgi:hypothetical protein